MMIIDLEPLETIEISEYIEVIRTEHVTDELFLNHKVLATKTEDFSIYKGAGMDVEKLTTAEYLERLVPVQNPRNNTGQFTKRMIRFWKY